MNRFDAIRNKERCRRLILEQIRELSPQTFADSDDLVHFVSANSCLSKDGKPAPDFARLEACLRGFTLENRFKSKLAPAKTYLETILGDVHQLAVMNIAVADQRHVEANEQLHVLTPVYESTLEAREEALHRAEEVSDDMTRQVNEEITSRLNTGLARLGDTPMTVEWPGLLYAWPYALEVRAHMVSSITAQVIASGESAATSLRTAAEDLVKLHEKYTSAEEVIQPPKIDPLLLSRPALDELDAMDMELALNDFLDLSQHTSAVSLSAGALSLVGGKVLSYQSWLASASRLGSVLSSASLRRAAILSLILLGMLVRFPRDGVC